jgi:hypothetical protein
VLECLNYLARGLTSSCCLVICIYHYWDSYNFANYRDRMKDVGYNISLYLIVLKAPPSSFTRYFVGITLLSILPTWLD